MFLYTALTPFILAAFALSMWAQFRVKGNFERWSRIPAYSGITGAQAARRILDDNGLYHVRVEPIGGTLTDHFNPTSNTVCLSEDVYFGNSIASISIASHEVGHAIQHKERYSMLIVRHHMVPVVNFASGFAPLLLMGGFFFRMSGLILIGILFFLGAVLFQVVTLPVEFNASSRAKRMLALEGIITTEETHGVNKMLGAAALTYVAATLMALLQLLEYVWIFFGTRRDD